MEASSCRSILVKEVSGQEDEIDLTLPRDIQDLAKGVDRVLTTNGIRLIAAEVIVCCEHDTETTMGE